MKKSPKMSVGSNSSKLMTWTGLSLKGLLLPNIDLFMVISGKYDEVLKLIGIDRRYKRWFFTTKGPNHRYNRYLKRMFGRLHNYAIKGEEEKFVLLYNLILKRSKVFRLLMLWKTDRNWYRTYSLTRIEKILQNFHRLVMNDVSKFKFKRVWIPKENGKMRPLSVPPYEWRMVTKSMNLFITIWTEGRGWNLTPHNYGVLKGAGTARAWDHVLSKLNKKFIYEFDLVKFFDMMPWVIINYCLRGLFPKDMIKKCEDLMKNSMAVMMHDALKERVELWNEASKATESDGFWSFLTWSKERKAALNSKNSLIFLWKEQTMRLLEIAELSLEGKHPRDYLKAIYGGEEEFWNIWFNIFQSKKSLQNKWQLFYRALVYQIKKENEKLFNSRLVGERRKAQQKLEYATFGLFRGLPQGMGLSPVLACLGLRQLYEKWPELTMYVDDGLIMSDTEIDIEKFKKDVESFGLYVSEPKSGWIKRNGVWLKPLKYLGLEYIPEKDTIRGKTRKGSEIEMPRLDIIKMDDFHFSSNSLRRKVESISRQDLSNPNIFSKLDLWSWVVAFMYGTNSIPKEKRVHPKSLFSVMKLKDEKVNFTSQMVKTCLDVVRNSAN